ncbi:O-antigen ligase family protein [Paenibacillus ginsengarvi]|uniref:O-antigen ligase domain-containing protein n=1 Tax=Paenibacillus ginsengarvi TaxID=400777 RepID=A0A3B0CN13_9BACL|nr:O-antigen ligase family protein [Paenibacillus ginsengarvi]RKN85659.1 O-antigen ligase domain-containing protein [Paenibacillus ginsengarvi]
MPSTGSKKNISQSKPLQIDIANWIVWIMACVLFVITLSSLDYDLGKKGPLFISIGSLELVSALGMFLFCLYKEYMKDGAYCFIQMYVHIKDVLLFYFWLAIVGLLYCLHPNSVLGLQNEGTHYLIYLIFLIMLVCTGCIKYIEKSAKWFAIAALLIYLYSVGLDVVQGGQYTNVIGRAAGFAENPNTGGYILVILIILSVNWNEYKVMDGVMWIMTAIGIFATLSRGGIIIFSLAFALYVGFVAVSLGKNRIKFLVKVSITTVAAFFIIYASSSFANISTLYETSTGQTRFERVQEMLNGDSDSIKSDSRVDLISTYINLIAESPFVGHGTGFSGSLPVGPHNLYLLVWTDYGLIGLLVLIYVLIRLLLFFVSKQNRAGIAFVLVFIVEGFFNHNLLTFQPFVTALALLSVSGLKTGSVDNGWFPKKSQNRLYYRDFSSRWS